MCQDKTLTTLRSNVERARDARGWTMAEEPIRAAIAALIAATETHRTVTGCTDHH